MPDVNPQSLEGYREATALPPPAAPEPASVPPVAKPAAAASPAPESRRPVVLAIVGLLALIAAGAGAAYLSFETRPQPWYVDKPLYTSRAGTTAAGLPQRIHATLLYRADGTYSASNTIYEYGKPPSERSYGGSWRREAEWICLRMNWMADKEFCNAFIKTDQGWVLLNRIDARTTPISLVPLMPPAPQELAPPPVPTPPPAPADCSFAGNSVAHAGAVTAFLASTVSAGQPCKAEIRTCTNGALSGSYQYASCAAAGTLPLPQKKPAAKHITPGKTEPPKTDAAKH